MRIMISGPDPSCVHANSKRSCMIRLALALVLLALNSNSVYAQKDAGTGSPPRIKRSQPSPRTTKVPVKLDSSPQGASIYLKDESADAVGTTPWRGFLKGGKSHQVILTKEGFEDLHEELRVPAKMKNKGKNKPVDFTFELKSEMVEESTGSDTDGASLPVAHDGAAKIRDGRLVAMATRVDSITLAMDGLPDEDVWNRAHVITNFSERAPDFGADPKFQTEVRILYDRDNFYVSAVMELEPGTLALGKELERDSFGIFYDHSFGIAFNASSDLRNSVYFAVTAGNVQFDWMTINNGERAYKEFDGMWTSAVHVEP